MLAVLGALALIAALIGSIRRPLDDLVSATQKLAAGDLSERVDPSGPQELRELDTAFNTMAERLEGAQSRIEAEREKLAITIESLGDALVVVRRRGHDHRAQPARPRHRPDARDRRATRTTPGARCPTSTRRSAARRSPSAASARCRSPPRASGDQDGDGIVWTIRDISERARLDRIKSDFVATASHELRSPLTSIKGFVELLGRSQALGEREREFVDVILQSTDRLVDLVNDLLDASRLEAGKMEVHPRLFDLTEVVREVAALMGPGSPRRTSGSSSTCRPACRARWRTRLASARSSPTCVSNAHLYTGEGGRITITLDRVEEGLELAVADSGRGMSQEEIDQAFDRFVRRDDGGSGTGLGLSIVKSLVDLQGGSIDVTSRPGEGTHLHRAPARPSPRERSGEAPRRAIRGKRVLVVDDERAIAELIVAKLEPFEVEAEIATSGEEAIERLREGRFDALTLDLMMDGMSGLDVLRGCAGTRSCAAPRWSSSRSSRSTRRCSASGRSPSRSTPRSWPTPSAPPCWPAGPACWWWAARRSGRGSSRRWCSSGSTTSG